MKTKYLKRFPNPLLDDLVRGRWLPIVGAGLSRNALVPGHEPLPLWGDIGKCLAREMTDYPYIGPLDAISAYSHEFSRSKLIERLADLLHVGTSVPGRAHESFCSIPFQLVCTTNFDFLLERQYEKLNRYCRPILDEGQIPLGLRDTNVILLKLHGDLHHPDRMVVTEEDYDLFLSRYPLISTYLASLLITHTPVFIGYSLDDPDFRQIWKVVSNRLGNLRRQAYSILVDPSPSEISRFRRRGVTVIGVPGSKSEYGGILAQSFDDLRDYFRKNLPPATHATQEAPRKELILPPDAASRLCFFAVPFDLLSLYKENVFPIAYSYGFVPVTADEVLSPGDTVLAKLDMLINRSSLMVADLGNQNVFMEVKWALSRKGEPRILLVVPKGSTVPPDVSHLPKVIRPELPIADPMRFLMSLREWFASMAKTLDPAFAGEPQRLLAVHEYRAAVISAMTLLESTLRKRLSDDAPTGHRPANLALLLRLAKSERLMEALTIKQIMQWSATRNQIVHSQKKVSALQAESIVDGVLNIVNRVG